MQSVSFIGGGRVTRILVGGWARGRALPAGVLVHDPAPDALEALEAVVPAIARVSLQEAAGADVVFIALHPPLVVETLKAIGPHLRPDAALVSLAPKIPIAMLEVAAGSRRVARMIPNAPSLVGQGYNPVTFGTALDERTRRTLAELFAPWGRAPEVAEPTLEAYAILTGMGPTYFWYQWQALRDVATALGLSSLDADTALRAMVDGALATLLDAGLTPPAVMDLVPVKPLQDVESGVTGAYRTILPALHAKIQPVDSPVD